MSRTAIEPLDASRIEFGIRILVEHAERAEEQKAGNPLVWNCRVSSLNHPESDSVVSRMPVRIRPNAIETIEACEDARFDFRPAQEKAQTSDQPRSPTGTAHPELKAIKIDYEKSRPKKKQKDLVLPIQDWFCIASLLLFEILVFSHLLWSV